MTDYELMGAALEEAARAAALGEVPVGAVVARNGEIIAAAHNTRETEKNALHRTHGLRSAPLSGQGRSCGEPAGLCECFRQVTIK